MGWCSELEASYHGSRVYLKERGGSMSIDVTLRRLSVLVNKYQNLGLYLQKCIELSPHTHEDLKLMQATLKATEKQMTAYEEALAVTIEDAMLLHEDMRRGKFVKRERAVAIVANYDSQRYQEHRS